MQVWAQQMARKPPVEYRPLRSPLSSLPQGTLELWVDILRKEEAVERPPFNIAPPPEQRWELRVICGKVLLHSSSPSDTMRDVHGLAVSRSAQAPSRRLARCRASARSGAQCAY